MNAKSFSRYIAAAALAAGVLVPLPSHAYRMIQNFSTGTVSAGNLVTCSDPNGFTHWNNANLNWYHNTGGVGFGKAFALFNVMNSWTFVPNASHNLIYRGTTSSGFSTNGLDALVWGSSGLCGSFNGCLALTALTLQAGQVITETDIIFSTDWTWTTNGNNYDIQAVATHELGHALGIHHSEFSSSTMWASYIGVNGRSLETDDNSAIQCAQGRYPPSVACIPNGGVDDTLGATSCCSGVAVSGSTYCVNPGDWGTTWASCHHICGTPLVGGCVPSGGIDDTLGGTSCCSGAAVSGSTRCLDPADYGTDWVTCVHTCA